MYTLATDQLSRTGETALLLKCRKMGYSQKSERFSDLILFLKTNGFNDAEKIQRWDALRSIRNRASHRRNQSIYPPAWAIGILETITVEINALFANE
ncbi:hypothetical protein [Methanoregula sp.]|uniref:hypothetical protein n=1 Tax=Methanoregula sp. TaxID=2052170 RepID=UPI003568F2CA